MANPIKLKRSKVPGNLPTTLNVQEGEIAQNTADAKIYMRQFVDGTNGNDKIVEVGKEYGGILHDIGSVSYVVGDMVSLIGSEYIFHCILDHVSAATCLGDTTNWTQPVVYIPVLEYNFFHTDLLGTDTGSSPAGLHVPGNIDDTTTPDENGPYYFSVDKPSAAKTAEVYIDGFKLPANEYSTTTDGYVKILSPVADNSWCQIKI